MVIVDDLLEASSDLIPSYASPNPSPARGVYGMLIIDKKLNFASAIFYRSVLQ